MHLRTVLSMLSLTAIILFLAACPSRQITHRSFGTAGGKNVDLYVLTNKNGVQASITNYGGALVSLMVPDRNGKLGDVILGYDDVSGYESDKSFFGATVGRYANRIAKGQFSLDGATYTLPKNDGPNTLHGGIKGFNKVVWDAKAFSTAAGPALQLNYTSKDGEEGFPGNLSVQVTYTLTDANELRIDYAATTDKDTVINLTNHAYYNLAGQGRGDILQHQVVLHASSFTPVDATLIPTGELRNVKDTPFDFTKAKVIGAEIGSNDEQLTFGKGYDHNWVLDGNAGTLTPAAEVYEPTTGRVLEIATTEPGIQFYSGNFLNGTAKGKGGIGYAYRTGLCLETQHFPDSPNHPNFPSTRLKAGEKYSTTTVYKFSTR